LPWRERSWEAEGSGFLMMVVEMWSCGGWVEVDEVLR